MPTGRRPSLAVVVPAHNEEEMIAGTLRAIAPQLVAGDRLIVVADNCSDATAAIATAAGATVIERVDQSHRGKGYALDFGVRHLERNPPEAVLIIDADCEIAPGAMDRLARLCLQSGRPVQALYLMRTPETVGIKTRVAEFAWLVKNHVRALGSHRLGIPCRLTGTGMAFPWSQIATAALASGHIVEDLKLGAHLARNGTPPLFCPEAVVMSYFPLTADGVVSQRVRWEHGHLGFILRDVPQLFLQAVRDRDCRLFALALDLSVPPLSLLSLLVLASIAGSLMFFAATASALPLLLTTASLAMLCVAVLLSWHRYGRGTISLTGLVYAPAYAFLKLPLYLKFLVRRQVEWVRSRRRGD
jgi:glycosyltransferase involved in cell wall biosynthesis